MELSDKWFAIVNPAAGNGRGLADWPFISKLLRDNGIIPDYAFTEHRYHATELAVTAVTQGYRKIIAIGGDGTLHETVNGIFIQKEAPATDITIGVIGTGSSNEWIRMYGMPGKYPEAVRAIAEGYSIRQDVGKVSFHKANYRQSRYMVNTAGVGLDAFVVKKCARLQREKRRSKYHYKCTVFNAILRYRSTGMKMWVDDVMVINNFVYSATVGIGRYSGYGMQHVPRAIADDGLFDVTVIRRISKLRVIRRIRSLYNGHIYDLEQASHHRGRIIRIESAPEIRLEVDGEPLGNTPVEFEIMDRAINLIVTGKYLLNK